MKNLILQVIMGDGFAEQPLTKLSINSAKAWADRIGAEYGQFTGPRKYKQVTAEKLNVFNEEYDVYDHIIVLDADIIVTDVAPNIFELYPQPVSGMPCSGVSPGDGAKFTARPSGGTLMYSREFRQLARKELANMRIGDNHCADEDAIKDICHRLNILPVGRDQKWDNFPPREGIRKDFYLIHFVGKCRAEWFKEEDWT